MDGNLFFGRANQPQGFQNLAMAQWDGNPEPIVREMLQNCLDASVAADRAAGEVCFTIRQVAVDEIPGIEAYREHFEGAVRERAKGNQGAAERRVIKRIRRVLAGPRTRVLFCRDNGIGLNADRMNRILTEGNTDKSAGAGALGIGHLTAFAASDLRFIHYAGRSRSNGTLRDVASAHAVLASRTVGENTGRGAHGFWLLGDDRTLFHRHPYPNTCGPPLLRSEMECLEDTGSVVGVIGFNDFHSDEKPVDAISRVAAKNFLVAIWNGSMVVHIRDETSSSEETVNRERLELILGPQPQKRAEQGGGWLSGEQAYRAWQTLEVGRKLHFEEQGVGGYFRPLGVGAKPRARSRVQVFRNGMWITNEADRLLPRDFNGFKPFDAIFEIDGGEVGDLIRGAEGPEHRGLERRRLGRRGSRQLLDQLKRLAARLQEEAGRVEQSEEFTPTGFAMFRGDAEREAEKVPAYRPRRSPVDVPAAEGVEGEESALKPDDVEGGPVDLAPGPGPRPKRPRRFTPKPGRSVRGRCSVRAIADADGQISQLRVMWRPPSGAKRSSDNLAVRVRIPSGSDETCVHPIGPQWLRISELHCNGEVSGPQDGAGFEVELPRGEEPFTIILADRIPDANAVEVDVVGRRPAAREGG